MKKIVAVLAVVVSTGTLAQTMNHSAHGNMNHKSMVSQIENLTSEQQSEYNALHNKHRADMQQSMLDIKDIDLKIQKEMLTEKPNQKNISKLIDQKAKLQGEKQKEMLNFKIEAKEKFGIEMTGKMMNGDKKCKMMSGEGKIASKGMMNSGDKPMNEGTDPHAHQ